MLVTSYWRSHQATCVNQFLDAMRDDYCHILRLININLKETLCDRKEIEELELLNWLTCI